ncbi:MAG TPA: hypothetical protein VMS65_17450 [Polyangiaceae bacterium]|nr:hypothetical protein [Polyangiaceae bacterium]
MGDAERDEAPTTPPKAIRPGGPTSGTRSESVASVEVDVSTTELSITEPSARDPNTLMSLPKPEPSDKPAAPNVRAIEDRLEALELRVRELENRRDPFSQNRATPWWFWVLFVFGLAATWRLLEALK